MVIKKVKHNLREIGYALANVIKRHNEIQLQLF